MKNINYVIKKLSIEKGIPEPIVRKAIQFYWNEALAKVNTLEYQALYVKNIGTFYIEYNLLRRNIRKMINSIRIDIKDNKVVYLQKLLKIRSKISKHYFSLWRQ
jgi:hypothetical protein